MLTSVTVVNEKNQSITMELSNPWRTGLNIKSITGLGPVKADINISNLSLGDGGLFNSSRANTRNIVFTIAYMLPNIEANRRKLYTYFPIKTKVMLYFEFDNGDRYYTHGYVESNDVNIFSQNEESIISVQCPESYFYKTDNANNIEILSETTNTITNAFEFPFENNSLTKKLIEFGTLTFTNELTIYYYGDLPTGYTITARFYGEVTNFVVYTNNSYLEFDDEQLKKVLASEKSFQEGDVLTINTEAGKKSIMLTRNRKTKSILSCVNNLSWFSLVPGNNTISFSADHDDGQVSVEVSYSNKIQGL